MQHVTRRVFAARASAVAEVRRFATSVLADFPRLGDVELCVSEIFTNAVVHGSPDGGEVRVIVRRKSPARVYVAVVDTGGPTVPRVLSADVDAEGCRGLQLVAAVATAWGHVPDPRGGRRVWCEVAAR